MLLCCRCGRSSRVLIAVISGYTNGCFQQPVDEESYMATYECKVCGMSVNATCGKCNAPLENKMLKINETTEVQVSECPNGHGKIKSPLCCGQDMTCSL
jgi:hypothetical protein